MVTFGRPLGFPEATEMRRMLATPDNEMNVAEGLP
jgi:hypothetical protein